MKLLVTGKYGQVNFELQPGFASLDDVVEVDQGDCDIANSDAIRQLVQELCSNAMAKPINVLPEAVKVIVTADYPIPAKRPANSRINTAKYRKTVGLALPRGQGGLSHTLQRIL